MRCARLIAVVLLLAGTGAGYGQEKLPLGELPAGKVLLVAQPHHDDHTTDYGMGGAIARFVESGYKAYYVRASNDEKDGANGYGRNDIINLKEAVEGTRILGMEKVISLNWRNDFMNPIPLNELREQLIFLIRKYKPDVVLGHNPWEHYQKNPDHRNVARALVEAYWLAGYDTVHPEHFLLGVRPHAARHYYGKGRLDWGLGQVSNVALELNESQVRKKERAIAAHRNVYHSPAGARAIRARLAEAGQYLPEFEGISDDAASDLLMHWWMNWNSRDIGKQAGVKYAEDLYYMDEMYALPGLRAYVQANARKAP
jgi:LmbE family N-acetylglucosaminyl deacetylase